MVMMVMVVMVIIMKVMIVVFTVGVIQWLPVLGNWEAAMCWALYTLSRLLFAAVQSPSCLTLCDPTDSSMPGFPVFPGSMFSPLANSMRQELVS